jgi:hypothetical protein
MMTEAETLESVDFNSARRASVKPMTANFVAEYALNWGSTFSAAMEEVLTTWPPPGLAFSQGRNALVPQRTPKKLTSKIHRHSFSEMFSKRSLAETPALLKTRSTRP